MMETRKLTAILFSDVRGYSRLVGLDDRGTMIELEKRRRIASRVIQHNGGTVVDTAGDSILAEFPSVTDAVTCAIDMQRDFKEINKTLIPDMKMEHRIGIHIGDVIHKNGQIFGDAVNISSRLQALVAPGKICISDLVRDQIGSRLSLTMNDIGRKRLKNISTPIRVFEIDPGDHEVGGAGVNIALDSDDAKSVTSSLKSTSGRPTVAVLPFLDLSGLPNQYHLADAISEDITTEVSRFQDIAVIARNSAFQYKDKPIDVRKVGQDLSARYVLEGSVQRATERVRITAQLIDATTGKHIWAERYERALKDTFAIQDEVARTVASLLVSHVNKAEYERTLLKPPAHWEAYDHFIRGNEIINTILPRWSAELVQECRRHLRMAIQADPVYARSYAALSMTYITTWAMPINDEYKSPHALNEAFILASKSIEIDPELPIAHATLADVLLWQRQFEESLSEWRRTFSLNPNFTDWRYSQTLMCSGFSSECIQAAKRHMLLDPHFPPMVACIQGIGYLLQKRFSDALQPLLDCVARSPNYLPGRYSLAAVYALHGKSEDAAKQTKEVYRIAPQFSIDTHVPIAAFRNEEDAAWCRDGLLRAGMT